MNGNPVVTWGAFVIVLLGLALWYVFSYRNLLRHNQRLRETVLNCPMCKGETIILPDPINACLLVQCPKSGCGHEFKHPVRTSALSFFGVIQHLAALGGAFGAYAFAQSLEMTPTSCVVAAVVGLLVSEFVGRFVLRFTAFKLLQRPLSPAWQEEIVAYLVPPQFQRSKSED